jgi:DNA-binding PadR family transcriptional regulator
MSDIVKETLRSLIRVHLLHHAAEGPIFGAEMLEELRRHGYRVSPGTLYPMLHAMQESRYLRIEARVVDGKVRKYYRCTARGRSALQRFRQQIVELLKELDEGKANR